LWRWVGTDIAGLSRWFHNAVNWIPVPLGQPSVEWVVGAGADLAESRGYGSLDRGEQQVMSVSPPHAERPGDGCPQLGGRMQLPARDALSVLEKRRIGGLQQRLVNLPVLIAGVPEAELRREDLAVGCGPDALEGRLAAPPRVIRMRAPSCQARGMRFGLSIPNFAEPDRLLDIARTAEANGWDGWFLWDHILVDRDRPVPVSEPWTVLAAAAIATSHIRLGTMVTPLARRRPWVLARQVTTVDHLSKGRAVLGVGLGVPPEAEYAPFGESADPKQHAALVDEGLTVLDALWRGGPVTHHGPAFELDGVEFAPRPIQRPRVPIWSACSLPARAGVRRAARWDGIVPIYSTATEFRPARPDEVAGAVADIAATRATLDDFDVAVWTVADDQQTQSALQQAGATWIIEGPAPGDDWLDDAVGMASDGPPR